VLLLTRLLPRAVLVGNMSATFYPPPGLTHAEQQSHLAMWALLKSPVSAHARARARARACERAAADADPPSQMLISSDVASLTPAEVALLANKNLLAIAQDAGPQAKRVYSSAGDAQPQALTFDSCPPSGEKPLRRQVSERSSAVELCGPHITIFPASNCRCGRRSGTWRTIPSAAGSAA